MKGSVLFLLIFFFWYTRVAGQLDAHYWTSQYGAKGLLLNGAVIAASEDENAIFYNPASLGTGHQFGVSLSFLTPVFSNNTINSFLTDDSKFSDNTFGLAPGFAAVGFPLSKNQKFSAAVATFTRFESDVHYTDREITLQSNDLDVLNAASLEYIKQLNERWFGFGFSYQISETFSVGLSQFSVFRRELSDLTLHRDIFLRSDPKQLLQSYRLQEQYVFKIRGGFLTKIGASWKSPSRKLQLGVTITTPNYGFLIKHGSYRYDLLGKLSADSTFNRAVALDQIKPNHRSPLSIGIGLEYSPNDWQFYFTAEYFAGLKKYPIVQTTVDPFDGLAPTTDEVEVSLTESTVEVLNVALGVSKPLNNHWRFVLGGRTDFNPNRSIKGIQAFEILTAIPSVFHFSMGGLKSKAGKQLSIGLDLGFGDANRVQNVYDFEEVSAESVTFTRRSVEASFHSILLIFTCDFIFDKD